MPEPTLADLFEQARTLLDDKMVECAYTGYGHEGHAVLINQPDDIDPCHGSGQMPDPAYDALRRVVGNEWFRQPATQYPDGALEGALIKAVRNPDARGEIHYSAAVLSEVLMGILTKDGDTRIPAMQAFVKWLKGVT